MNEGRATLEPTAIPPAKRLYTYDELVAEMPETNQPCELWDGELIICPAPSFDHQETVLILEGGRYRLHMRCTADQTAASRLLPGFETPVNAIYFGE